MRNYYVQIDDCQNNTQAIIKVKASSVEAAEVKALKALHANDSIYTIDKESAIAMSFEGHLVLDENGEEIYFEDKDYE